MQLIIDNNRPLYLGYYGYYDNDYKGLLTSSQQAHSLRRLRDI